ncbi:MAG TPA: threonine ammonia-lyase [Nitrospirota bacterium]|nr:threonine ammonia-lyase [Nitrospirota bacterium]
MTWLYLPGLYLYVICYNHAMITLQHIQEAAGIIRSSIHRTPLIQSNSLSRMTGAEVWLKLENLQKTGSFKVRGAFNKLSQVSGERVVAASMGNHGQAVAYAANRLGKKAVIVMPETAAIVKEEASRGYGAEVVREGETLSHALAAAEAMRDAVFIHPFDDDAVIAGQGTVGMEIAEDLQGIDAVFAPIGGGGLIAGLSLAVKMLSAGTAVIGVQAEAAPAGFLSRRERKIAECTPLPTIADGIAVARIGERTFESLSRHVDDVLLVSDDAISRAVLLLMERKKLVVEGAGAVPLAALLEHADRFRGKRVVLVLSGGNIDFTVVDRIIRRGLVTSGRIGMLPIMVPDAPGGLHAVTGLLASMRANILDVVHDRFAADLPFGMTRVVITAEIRGKEHLDEIRTGLMKHGYRIS